MVEPESAAPAPVVTPPPAASPAPSPSPQSSLQPIRSRCSNDCRSGAV
ncbi:MAG: hypothetical protein HC840_13015 [Leptolyngbyaceae cyanobacterium RM2_2_4]|nr:hypothetical protein [Leptolyngbyaceae cyanobacterium RM2_2_4]